MKKEVPIWKKITLTIREAAAYSGIGEDKMRNIVSEHEELIVQLGNRKLVKRAALEEYFVKAQSI